MIPEIVRGTARRFGAQAALVASEGWAVSYAELDRASDEAALGLAAAGVGEGDLVALVLPSTPEYVVAYLAIAKLGAIVAGVNPRYTAAERTAVLDVARPRLVVCTAALAEGVAGLTAPAAGRGRDPWPHVVVSRSDGAAGAAGVLAELRIPGDAPPPLPPDPDRVVAVVFTSGTTGTPRGAVFTNRQIHAIARSDVPTWDDPDAWGGGSPMLASTQFPHVGFSTKLAWYLRTGARQHLIERWRPAEVLSIISEQRMASIGGIAPQLAILLRSPDLDRYDLSSVRTVIMGGAHSPPELVREARRRLGAAYSIRYSSTESGGIGTGTAFDADDDEALHTVGRPRPGVELQIRSPDDDRPLPPGAVGEVCLRSGAVMRGYWRDPEATAAVLRDGWLHTGDLGVVDEAGCLRLAGRAKEMYVRGGYNVYPLEVEAVLRSHPDVADVVVVPRADEVMGEVGVAVVVPHHRLGDGGAGVPSTPGAPDLEELRRFAGERLARYKLPEALVVVDELPYTPMHKVDRKALQAVVAS